MVREVWTAVTELGFTEGTVLEHGYGAGTFIGAAPDGARMVGVGLDPLSAGIARALYPNAHVLAESFADTRAADASFDLSPVRRCGPFIASTAVGREPNGEVISRIALGMMAPPDTFSDLAVLHLMTTATLAELAFHAPDATFDARRYRPNLLLDAPGRGFIEDDWVNAELSVGDQARVSITMPTMRCVMTTLAQADLPEDRQTLRTIAKHNRREITGLGRWACAGVYGAVTGGGVVRRGDEVRVAQALTPAG